MAVHEIDKQVLKDPNLCRDYYIDFFGNESDLVKSFPNIVIYGSCYEHYLEKERKNGIYADPYSDQQTGRRYMLRIVGDCQWLRPFGCYRKGQCGGFECKNPHVPEVCKVNFKYK